MFTSYGVGHSSGKEREERQRTRIWRVDWPKRSAEGLLGACPFWPVRYVLVLEARIDVQSIPAASGKMLQRTDYTDSMSY